MLFRIIYSYVSRPNRSYVVASSSLFRANCENIKTFKKNARRWAGGQVEKTYQPPANSVFYCARVKAKRVDGKTFQEKRPENFSHQALT